DIEGKPARVRDEGDGKRPSFKSVAKTLQGSSRRLAAVTNRPAACAPQSEYVDRRIKRCLIACQQLREASNEGTLRAFRNADRFTTFKSFAGRALFDDVSLQVNRGDRIGLVGPNGAGKSTLFALLLGDASPDNGTIAIEKNATIGFLPQETAAAGDEPVLDLALAVSPALGHAQK